MAPTWQYFGTLICDRLYMGLCSYRMINPKSEFSAAFQNYLPVGH